MVERFKLEEQEEEEQTQLTEDEVDAEVLKIVAKMKSSSERHWAWLEAEQEGSVVFGCEDEIERRERKVKR